ncbi:MAG TPA: DinB family protein [Gemmataceae bacterium]|nr:DinB family protein [Gemmataceae bacterium]
MPVAPVDVLLRLIDQGYDRKAWHGPNLRGSIRGIEARIAGWRPATDRRCIAEIVVHAAYWKYAVRRRLLGEKRGSFPLKGSNWFPRPDVSPKTWGDDVALLEQMHRALRAAVADLSSKELTATPPGRKVSNLDLIAGIAAHDVYHAGQIQLLKRLAGAGADE